MDDNPLPTPVQWATELVRARVPPGAWAVDATAGNGHDTLLLTQLVGANGRVFAFDVQAAALAATRALLLEAHAPAVCTFIHDGHEHLAQHLPAEARGQLAAVMFNLGWLPGHDKALITRAETTLEALRKSIEWLKPGGLITVVVYPNHAHGPDEAQAVAEWICGLSAQAFEARNLRSHYRVGKSPEGWAIRKRPN